MKFLLAFFIAFASAFLPSFQFSNFSIIENANLRFREKAKNLIDYTTFLPSTMILPSTSSPCPCATTHLTAVPTTTYYTRSSTHLTAAPTTTYYTRSSTRLSPVPSTTYYTRSSTKLSPATTTANRPNPTIDISISMSFTTIHSGTTIISATTTRTSIHITEVPKEKQPPIEDQPAEETKGGLSGGIIFAIVILSLLGAVILVYGGRRGYLKYRGYSRVPVA